MSFDPIIHALALPSDSRVDQRVPKNILLEQGMPTSADKHQIQEGINEMFWIAALKPTNIGVPIFRDNVREYLEIEVITVTLHSNAKSVRLIELIHRIIPYPIVLATMQDNAVSLSLAHKRWSQGETGKVVIENICKTAPLRLESPSAEETSFLTSLALSTLPCLHLFVLYQGWLDRIVAFEAASITGRFTLPDSAYRTTVLRQALDTYDRLQNEITLLRTQAMKEKQINRRVELNLEIQRLDSELHRLKEML